MTPALERAEEKPNESIGAERARPSGEFRKEKAAEEEMSTGSKGLPGACKEAARRGGACTKGMGVCANFCLFYEFPYLHQVISYALYLQEKLHY